MRRFPARRSPSFSLMLDITRPAIPPPRLVPPRARNHPSDRRTNTAATNHAVTRTDGGCSRRGTLRGAALRAVPPERTRRSPSADRLRARGRHRRVSRATRVRPQFARAEWSVSVASRRFSSGGGLNSQRFAVREPFESVTRRRNLPALALRFGDGQGLNLIAVEPLDRDETEPFFDASVGLLADAGQVPRPDKPACGHDPVQAPELLPLRRPHLG